MSQDAWIAQCAAALCRGARWLLAFSFALAVLAAARLLIDPRQALAMTLALGAGFVQAYFALRIELDARIFDRFAADPSGAPEFDAALAQAGWAPPAATPRPMADRMRGLRRLVAFSAGLLALQVAALVATGWLGP